MNVLNWASMRCGLSTRQDYEDTKLLARKDQERYKAIEHVIHAEIR